MLEAVAGALSELVPHDSLRLFQANPLLRALRPVLVRDVYEEAFMAMGPFSYGQGITGIAAETRVPQLVNDVHLDPRGKHIPGTPHEPESLLAVPLVARDDLKGVLALSRLGEQNHFSLEEFKLVVVFSELAALAIDNAQIRSRLETEVVTDHLTALHNHRYFHERIGEELRRASRLRLPVGLIIYDIDDFKRVNDTCGHLVGDQVLQGVASLSRELCRREDVVCRIGGEEFAVVLPGSSMTEAVALAERLRRGIGGFDFPTVGRITVSLGVAEGALHASSPRELVACADLALLEAKANGKNQVLVYVPSDGGGEAAASVAIPLTGAGSWHEPDLGGSSDPSGNGDPGQNGHGYGRGRQARMAVLTSRGELRSAAQLRVLHSLAAKLNRLTDVGEIGGAITLELRSLIDYHNCRVFLLQADGETLLPIAFRGELSEYQGETFDALVTQVGTGLTGHVALTGQSHYAPDANEDPYAVTIPGTPDLDESILGVPLKYGDRVTGVVVLSKLGLDQFDEEDRLLLETLASSAGVALENARLFQAERESAQASAALLWLSRVLTRVTDRDEVLGQAMDAIPAILSCGGVAASIRDPETGSFRVLAHRGFPRAVWSSLERQAVSAEVAADFLKSVDEPFVLSKEDLRRLPREHVVMEDSSELLVAPMRWEPDGLGTLAILADHVDAQWSPRDVQLARGIADITSLALGNAHRFDELERAYVSTVEALAGALEAKDQYTEDHCRALAELATRVGAEMGLPPDRLKVLELGALFHDIGKIGIPSEIIRKPGPLTAIERRQMNQHPRIGSDILAPVPFLQPVRPIVRASHERWDGNGYPDGLVQDEIPIESRIVFVCDAFHAMTTDRPYRKALPEREAIRRLRLSAGTQFDPAVVTVFTRLHAAGAIHIRN